MVNSMKKIIALFFLINTFKLYAYDYRWPVDYEIKYESLKTINKTVSDFIHEHPEFQVYALDWDTYFRNVPDGPHIGIENEYYKLELDMEEVVPFGKTLCGNVYLEDVKAIVHFYIPHVLRENGQNLIRLVSYNMSLEKSEGQVIRKEGGKYTLFNDVEPTKKEIPIKESFERNFLSKLKLEWEYVEPADLDKWLSKFLTFFRKRKNFPDD